MSLVIPLWVLVVYLLMCSNFRSVHGADGQKPADDDGGDTELKLPVLADPSIDNGRVCGHDVQTYASVDNAHNKLVGVMHCAACGKCSNQHDIQIYEDTKETLTSTTTNCAIKTLLFGERIGQHCMRTQVGFTSACNDCWMANIHCDIERCLWVCLKHRALQSWKGTSGSNSINSGDKASSNNGNQDDLLDPCLRCDETHCGPAFGQCAGANRRRAGIKSDIDRPGDEICSCVDPWPSMTSLQPLQQGDEQQTGMRAAAVEVTISGAASYDEDEERDSYGERAPPPLEDANGYQEVQQGHSHGQHHHRHHGYPTEHVWALPTDTDEAMTS